MGWVKYLGETRVRHKLARHPAHNPGRPIAVTLGGGYSVEPVRSLSSLLHRDDAPDQAQIRCRPAGAGETIAALRLILGTTDATHISQFLLFAQERQINLDAIWVAEAAGALIWAVLPVPSPGQTMLLFTAAPPRGKSQALAGGALLDAVCSHFQSQGVRLAQSLLDPSDSPSRAFLESHGFRRIAQLDYLNVLVRANLSPPPDLRPGLIWETYSPQTHGHFAAAILASYERSLDCPALNGLRDINDIIAGHQATGQFDPNLWFVLRDTARPPADQSLGVLLLNTTPRSDAIELVYLGIAPAARGHGLGDLLMKRALYEVSQRSHSLLSLAVDAANPPALKLYHRHGLQKFYSKVALMRELPGRSNSHRTAAR